MQDARWDKSDIISYGRMKDVADALAGLAYSAPMGEFSGADSIEIEVIDAGGLAAFRTIKVDVEASCPPKIERVGRLALLPEHLRIDEDSDLSIDALEIVMPETGAKATVQVEIFCSKGVLSMPFATKDATLSIMGEGAGTVVVAGPPNRINNALHSLSYRPNAEVWGSDELSIVVRKGINGSSGVWSTVAEIKSMIILIDPFNDPPIIDIPVGLMGEVLPVARGGEALALTDIQVRDTDAAEPAGTELISINISTSGIGNMVALAGGSITVQGRMPGVRFFEGSAEGVHPRMAFRGRIDLVNGALGLLHFLPPFGQPSGFDTVTITVSDNGNWGGGGENIVTANIPVEVIQQDLLADFEELVRWDTPQNALTMDEDGRLDIIGISLLTDASGLVPRSTLVDVFVAAERGVVDIGGHTLSSGGMASVEIARHAPGLVTVSGAISDVSTALTSWTYFPEPNYHGFEKISLSAQGRRGSWERNASVPVVVFSQPDAPSVTILGATSSPGGRTVEVGARLSLYGIVVEHVDDLDEDQRPTVTLRARSTAGKGSLLVDEPQPGVWAYVEESIVELVVRGRACHLQSALDSGALTYVPKEGYNGLDVVSLRISADSPFGDFGVEGKWKPPEENDQAEAEVDVNVVPAFVTAAVVLQDGALFHTMEGVAVEITGIIVRAPGRWNTSETVVTINLYSSHGLVTLPGASSDKVLFKDQGEFIQITGKELDINIALARTLFKSAPFYNGFAEIKVRYTDYLEASKHSI